jgi:L-threonine kinase
MEATAHYPNTCGELVQGLVDGRPLLVSCPIDRYSRATVRLGHWGPYRAATVWPKATLAVQAVLRRWSLPHTPYTLEIENPLPVARGFGTSTADLCAAAQATARAIGTELSPAELTEIALGIEPSDGTMWPGLVAFGHRGAGLLTPLGAAPALGVVVLDLGGAIDSEHFNAHDRSGVLAALAPGVRWALDLVRRGVEAGEPALIGRGATASALLHQSILCNPLLPPALALARRAGALGLCRAHSGTVLGLLLAPDQDPAPVLREATALPGVRRVWLANLVGGGEQIGPAPGGSGEGRLVSGAASGRPSPEHAD